MSDEALVEQLTALIHGVMHHDEQGESCTDTDCLDGAFTDDEIADAILARYELVPKCDQCGTTQGRHSFFCMEGVQ
jgi:hypothetical protein